MKKPIIKILTAIASVVVGLPVLLIVLFLLNELAGSVVNHVTTYKQTKELTAYIEENIENARIVDVYSETGNTGGTGNYEDCLSKVTFTASMTQHDVVLILSQKYDYNYDVEYTSKGYVVTLRTTAPFFGKIVGY